MKQANQELPQWLAEIADDTPKGASKLSSSRFHGRGSSSSSSSMYEPTDSFNSKSTSFDQPGPSYQQSPSKEPSNGPQSMPKQTLFQKQANIVALANILAEWGLPSAPMFCRGVTRQFPGITEPMIKMELKYSSMRTTKFIIISSSANSELSN